MNIALILIWSSLALIVINYFISKNERKKLEEISYSEYLKSKEELYNLVGEVLGEWEENCLREGKIWTSMPKPLLLIVKGNPHDIKESVTTESRYATWYYEPQPYQYGGQTRYKYGFQVSLQNNIVTGWSDL